MRKMLGLLAIVLLPAMIATAQTRSITGKIVDEKGGPIPYASIIIKGSETGVAADASGHFKISAKTGDVLVIKSTGFSNKEVTVSTSDTLSISMTRQTSTVNKVVATTPLGLQYKTMLSGNVCFLASTSSLGVLFC